MAEPERAAPESTEPERIAWNEWSADIFERAAREGKLVFLDISATWCHWCHVLDATSFADRRVVRILNEAFIPVRVDTDRRPDINDRYNQGGWPTTAILLPNGRILTGATYLPPDALYAVLSRCASFYARERDAVDRHLREEASAAGEPPGAEALPVPRGPRPEDLALVKHALLAQYDATHPGFFKEPKFLMPEALALLLESWTLERSMEMGERLGSILRRMAQSEVQDTVEGGFFRYATKRDWSAPHYEKLLPDNAEMLAVYASSFEESGDALYARTSEGILRFLFARLFDPATGAFFASQDADEEYYRLPGAERSRRIPPAVDRTVISEYNGKAVSALLRAHRAFGRDKEIPAEAHGSLLDRALRLGEFLRTAMWSEEEGQIRFRVDGRAQAGHLADNVSAATAFLDLWEATDDEGHLSWAGRILDGTVRRFYSAKKYGFLDRRPGREDLGPSVSLLVPFGENARMAAALFRYARAAVRTDLFAIGEQTLKGLSEAFDARGAFSAPYGRVLLLYWKGSRGTVCLPDDPSCAP